jgi:hypothetical protein
MKDHLIASNDNEFQARCGNSRVMLAMARAFDRIAEEDTDPTERARFNSLSDEAESAASRSQFEKPE